MEQKEENAQSAENKVEEKDVEQPENTGKKTPAKSGKKSTKKTK